ncbi:hypothetical protein FHS89_000429 [Rubricella aquisinus]|uniref:YkgJ family cysteine cluster protein n=1 Tax=Rubricella aquisinus TaxID=2028108 RepID=A0A840WIV7_9RHOB|nr:YkgJ family cysteine cluster protein [Rubricella aquisinus]MBB5514431.1 hypothetical protein [Rubricella aquisinus]
MIFAAGRAEAAIYTRGQIIPPNAKGSAVPPKPPTGAIPRAARRKAQAGGKSGALTYEELARRIDRARLKGAGKTLEPRVKRVVMSYLQSAQTHGLPLKQVVTELANGQAAWRLGGAVRDAILQQPPEAVKNAACGQGCAFCCILTGGDGGLITEAEARRLHAALTPLQGEVDGRAWHPSACPALNPDTRACRVYDARPTICRSFLSTDAAACEANANGATDQGAGLLGSHLDYLFVQSLCRQALKGITQVSTYSMAQIAAAALDGQDVEQALARARHRSKTLDDTAQDAARAAHI